MQAYFDLKEGIVETLVGYANGNIDNPTYEQVCNENTNFAETIYIKYDETQINIEKLLSYFWKVIDPTSLNKQGNDSGSQYRTGIYYADGNDLEKINVSVNEVQKILDKKVVTEIEKLKNFYPAEEYHQKYLQKNPNGYCHINLDL